MSGHIYVVQFSDGTVKPGFSSVPDKRMKQHASNAACFGLEIDRQWVSPLHVEAAENERTLLKWCGGEAECLRRAEYFTGIDFYRVVEFASCLPMTSELSSEWVITRAEGTRPVTVNKLVQGFLCPHRRVAA